MKKYRIVNKFRFITCVTLAMLITAFSFSSLISTVSASDSKDNSYVSVKVEAGDTLWTLAKEYGPNGYDIRRVIYEIEKLNGINASDLKAGQMITIPTEKL